jgi:hypothetical protein
MTAVMRRADERMNASIMIKFHQMIVGRIGGRLEDVDILAAHIFLDLDEYLLVRKASHGGATKGIEVSGDGLGQHPVRIARKKASLSCPGDVRSGEGLLAA